MPRSFHLGIRLILPLVFFSLTHIISTTYATKEINQFYIRYDIKSAGHQIFDARLTMIPAEAEFRTEQFSLSQFSGVITGSPAGESGRELELRAKENALKMILKMKGLKSVNTLNTDTVVSYEGVVQVPVRLWLSAYDSKQGGYPFTARIRFASLAFPDKWKQMGMKRRIKEVMDDFFLLFR